MENLWLGASKICITSIIHDVQKWKFEVMLDVRSVPPRFWREKFQFVTYFFLAANSNIYYKLKKANSLLAISRRYVTKDFLLQI